MQEQQERHFQEEEESMDIMEILFVILKRWKVATLIFLLVSSLGAYKVYSDFKNQVPIYISSTRISLGRNILEVQNKQGEIIKRTYSINDEIEFLRSDTVAKETALVLKDQFGYSKPDKALVAMVKTSFKGGGSSDDKGENKAAKQRSTIRKQEIKGDKAANIITISAYTNDPQNSFDMVSALLTGYQKAKEKEEAKALEKMNKTYLEQSKTAYGQLLAAENVLAQFIKENKNIITVMRSYNLTNQEDKDIISDLLNEKHIEVKDSIIDLEAFLNDIEYLSAKDKLATLSLISKKYGQFVDLNINEIYINKEEKLNELLQINEEAHPAVIQMRGELDTIVRKMDRQIENAKVEINRELNSLKKKSEELSELIETDLYEKLISYNMLKKDVILKRQAYDSLSESLYQVDLGEKLKNFVEIRILEPHKLARVRSNKIDLKAIAVVLFGAAFLSIGVAYGLEKLDTSISDAEELEKIIDLPILATIPKYNVNNKERGAQ